MALDLKGRWRRLVSAPPPLHDRESLLKMIGTFLRDAAMLIIVFAPLDAIIQLRDPTSHPLTRWEKGGIVLTAAIALTVGLTLERRRKS